MAWKNCFSTGLYKSFLAEIVWVILNPSKILWVVKNTTGLAPNGEHNVLFSIAISFEALGW